ncbi:MAG TPA: hypothetical protein VKX49_00765 [Bryobacteraceae bacterium]|nr:hypothetical protein [Bryobacteraceae bacterium]
MGSSSPNLFLVDDEGNPLPQPVMEAVQKYEPAIFEHFADAGCDPAELSDGAEHTARKVTRFWLRSPSLQGLSTLVRRSLFNTGISAVRKRGREQSLSAAEQSLHNLALTLNHQNPESELLRGEKLKAVFLDLTDREQLYIHQKRFGFDDEEIAAHLKISKHALAQMKHRLKAKLLERGLLRQ